MLHLLTPHLRVESVLNLTINRLAELEINSLLLDVDCTLKRYHETDVQPEIAQWINTMKAGEIGCCIISNGLSHRIKHFADKVGLPFVDQALKPFPCGVYKALNKMAFDPNRTAIVGDQIFADVLAGRLAGIKCILVKPIHPEEEPCFTRLKRPPERLWLSWLDKRDMGGPKNKD